MENERADAVNISFRLTTMDRFYDYKTFISDELVEVRGKGVT